MLAVLNFSHRDSDTALNLLRWIAELGGCKGHELILSCNRMAAEAGLQTALAEEAAKSFDRVEVFVQPSEDERGWPVACNHAWREMVFHIRRFVQKPWLWLEPDVTPRKPGWMDAIAAEYERQGGGFLGCDVDVPGSRRHVSGIAVYPPNVLAACKRRFLNGLNGNADPSKCEAWDMYFAAEFLPHAKFTKLIQHVQFWPQYPDAPTFKENGPEIHPEAVLFHRCKDGSLIERLRANNQPGGAGANPAEFAGSRGVTAASAATPGAPEKPASISIETALRERIAELEQRLSGASASVPAKSGNGALEPSLKTARRISNRIDKALDRIAPRFAKKKKDTRTPEQIQAAKDRMAKARAGRKKIAA